VGDFRTKHEQKKGNAGGVGEGAPLVRFRFASSYSRDSHWDCAFQYISTWPGAWTCIPRGSAAGRSR